MSTSNAMIPDLIRQTLRDPRGAARRLIEMQLPAGPMWQALALVVLLSVLTGQGATLLVGGMPSGETMLPGFFFSPVLLSVVQGILLVLMVLAVHGIGRAFGGQGELPDAIVLVTWLQFLMVCLQIVQGIAMILLPPVASLLGLAGIVAFFYLLTLFVCELHGFDRPGVVFFGILASMIGIVLALSILLGLLGLGTMEMPDV